MHCNARKSRRWGSRPRLRRNRRCRETHAFGATSRSSRSRTSRLQSARSLEPRDAEAKFAEHRLDERSGPGSRVQERARQMSRRLKRLRRQKPTRLAPSRRNRTNRLSRPRQEAIFSFPIADALANSSPDTGSEAEHDTCPQTFAKTDGKADTQAEPEENR